jgi:hypothetical protein
MGFTAFNPSYGATGFSEIFQIETNNEAIRLARSALHGANRAGPAPVAKKWCVSDRSQGYGIEDERHSQRAANRPA